MLNASISRVLIAGLIALLGGSPLAAQDAASRPAGGPASPSSGSTVYLLTMGQGDMVWEKFGHNALWVHDPVRGTDWVYNYGVFDFRSPGYWSRFIKGTWIYQIDAADIYQTVAQYQYLNRTLVAQELNLTPAQAAELQTFLETNLRPENREYRYDYFRDNCSTRVRDALDRVLDGQLRSASEKVPTETTYRWHSRRLIADDRMAYAGMNIGLGPDTDRPIDAWEEMFLPEKVKQWVGRTRVVSPEGGYRPLVRSERALYQAIGRDAERDEAPGWIPSFLLVGVAVGGLIALSARYAHRGIGRFALAAVGGLWTLLIGTVGVVLMGLWAFTDHSFAHRNENLLHFNPLALALVLLVPLAAYGARWALRPAAWLTSALVAMSVLGLVIQVLPGLDQVNGEAIALTLPAHLALAWATYRIGRRGEAPNPGRSTHGAREGRPSLSRAA